MKLFKLIAFNNLTNKISAIVVLALISCNIATAAVSPYTFAASSGTYTAISGTTLVASTTTSRWDDVASSLQTIPFTFTYNGNAYTTLGVNSNGYVVMGAVSTTTTNYCGAQGSEPNTIIAYGTDLVGGSLATTSNISVATRGTAPNRQYVIQWNDCSHWTNATYTDHWSFQIILNETSNTVQIVWGNSTDATTMGANTCADSPTESGSVGLVGAANTDYNLRSVTNSTNTWATSIAGTALNAVCNMSSTNIPANGLTYTWTPAPAVAMSYSSCTTSFLNNSVGVPRSSTNNQIIRIQVTTTGSLTPLSITSLVLSTSGCTDASTDISNAKIYYTALSTTFATTTQFGSTSTNPNGSFTINGTATLAEGVNNFWLVYDIKSTANYGDVLSACCTQITGSTGIGTVTPTVSCPTGLQTIYQVGTWTPVVANAPSSSLGHMMLLSDGTALCKSSAGGSDGYGNQYYKLTPDANGSYANGSWTAIAPMNNTRLWFSSQILKDGRLYVAGGEYGTGLAAGEVYDPLLNTWTLTGAPGANISDANSEILEDGRVLQAIVAGALTGTKIYNPTTNTYSTGPTARGIHNESAWLKLPDNSVLYVDRLNTSSERYIPATNTWVADGTVPVSLYDPYGDETGAAFLLPDGRGFFLGALGHTAYYTPSGNTTAGTWAAGPDIPNACGTPDAGAAMMVNGKIICAVSPTPTAAQHFPSPTTFYEFDYTTNTFTLVSAPNGTGSINSACYTSIFLDLPNGQVLYSTLGSTKYYLYTPVGSQIASGKPTINNISQITCDSFSITGNLFNGISQGACYGDDGQMASNFPIIRLTSGSNVYYARTSNWNSTGVMRGTAADTTKFKLSAGLPAGNYQLVVIANGISSDPISFTANPTLTSVTTAPSICSGTAFTYTPTSTRTNASFSWTRAAVTNISNAAITTAQTSNPNEVLVNTSSSPVNVIYTYTINAGSCSNTQDVLVVVNPSSTSTSNISICSNNLPYSWNGQSFTAAGSYVVHLTNTKGCDSAATLNLIVNQTSSSITNVSVCSNQLPFSWNAQSFTVAGSYVVHLTSSKGCDSAATLNLTVNQTSISVTNASVCSNQLPYSWNGQSFASAGSYIVHLTSSKGCDSAATLNLTVNQTSNSVTSASVCSNQLPYSWNGQSFAVAGSYVVHLTNSTGCDSAATLNLSIKNNYSITASAANNGSISPNGVTTVCSGNNQAYIITPNGGYYISDVVVDGNSQGSISTYTFTNVTSNHTISASFVSTCVPNSSTTNLSICSSQLPYSWNGQSLTATGSYIVHLTNAGGCDSAATLNLSVTQTLVPSITISTASNTVCSNNSITFTATGVNTGSAPIYQWKKNGANISTGTTITFAPNALTTGDVINCTLTANNICQANTIANSNNITVTVSAAPSVLSIKNSSGATITSATMCSLLGTMNLYNATGSGVWSSDNALVATVATSGVVTAIANGVATIKYTVTNANNCSAFTFITINVAAVMPPSSIAGASTLCVGSSTTYTTASTGGVWSTQGRASITTTGIATGSSAGTTSIVYTITNNVGCSNYASLNITVIAIPAVPSIAFAAGTSGVSGSGGYCKNKTFTLIGTPSGGVWSSTGTSGLTINSSGFVNTGTTTGTTAVTYTYTNVCSNSRTISSNIVACKVSQQSAVDGQQLTIYPNPTRSIINLNVKTLVGAGSIVITDLYGKQLKQQTLSIGTNTIDVSSFAKGMYLVSVITESGKQTQKIIVE